MRCCERGVVVPRSRISTEVQRLPCDSQDVSTYSKDNCADIVIKSGCSDSLLVGLWSTGFIGENEPGSNPHGGGTKHKSRGHRLAVEKTSSSNDLDGLSGHWALLALDHLHNGGDKDSCGDISGVTTTLTSLGANDICTGIKAFLNMLRVADHVHVEDTGGMQALNNMLWWNTNCRDKELGSAFNDYINKLIKLALGVVIANRMLITAAKQ